MKKIIKTRKGNFNPLRSIVKNRLIVASLLVLFASCSKQADCNSDEVKQLVLEIISDDAPSTADISDKIIPALYLIFLKSGIDLGKILDPEKIKLVTETSIIASKFLLFKGGDGIITSVTTLKKSKNGKMCECEGEFGLSKEAREKMEKLIPGMFNPDLNAEVTHKLTEAFLKMLQQVHIEYDVKITDDGELGVEVYQQDNEHRDLFSIYAIFNNRLTENNKDNKK